MGQAGPADDYVGEHRAPEPVESELPYQPPGPPVPEPVKPTEDLIERVAAEEFKQPEATGAIWTKAFWKDAAERAIKSFGQGVVVGLGLIQAGDSSGLTSLPLVDALVVGGGMAVASVLTSLGCSKIGPKGTPSVVKPRPPRSPSRRH
jgi:Putative lactococcus lactis phage r1t holin